MENQKQTSPLTLKNTIEELLAEIEMYKQAGIKTDKEDGKNWHYESRTIDDLIKDIKMFLTF